MMRAARPTLLALLLAAAPAAAITQGPGPSSAPASPILPVSARGAAAGGATWVGRPPVGGARRIVTLAPSMTDYLVALGAADRIVGVTRVDHAPEVASRPRVGGFLDPSPEAVLALKPDLVLWVTDGGALAAVRRLAELSAGAFSILAVPVITVADVPATAKLVGEAIAPCSRVARGRSTSSAPPPRGGRGCASSSWSGGTRWWWPGPAPSRTS